MSNEQTTAFYVYKLTTFKAGESFWARVTGLVSEEEAVKHIRKYSRWKRHVKYAVLPNKNSVPYKIFKGDPEVEHLIQL